MAKLKFNSTGVSYAKRLATNAKNSSYSVREGIGTIQRNIQPDVAARNNIAARLNNVRTNVSQVENDILSIYQMVDNASLKYNNTEKQVINWGKVASQGKKISNKSANSAAFSGSTQKNKDKVNKVSGKKTSSSNGNNKKNDIAQREKKNIDVIVEDIKSIMEKDAKLTKTLQKDFSDSFTEGVWGNSKDELISRAMETTGGFVQKFAGAVNISTAVKYGPTAQNSFVIVNPSVSSITLKMSNVGGKIVTGAKVGLPIVGGIIDYVGMRKDGEEVGDAVFKSAVHVAVGLGGGKAGAAIGAAIGSVVPGAGTLVGGAIGFVAGVAITTVGNAAFDAVYDNWGNIVETGKEIASDVVEVTEKIGELANDVKENISGFFDGIGDACVGSWQSLRTAWT